MESIISCSFKTCRCCNLSFPRTEDFFHKCKEKEDGLKLECKNCRNKKGKEYSTKFREIINQKSRENYSKLTKDEKLSNSRAKRKRKQDKLLPKININFLDTRVCASCLIELPQNDRHFGSKIKKGNKCFNSRCRKCLCDREKLRYREKQAKLGLEVGVEKPKKEKLLKVKLTQEEQRLKRNKRKSEYRKNKYKEDINFRLRMCAAARITDALKRKTNKKLSKTVQMLGCNIDALRKHIESQFQDGMSWENYGYGDGKFHIDHIIPCSAFDFSREENQQVCFNWVNLKPEWHFKNISKNNLMPNGKYVENCSQNELDFYIDQLKEKIAGVNKE